MNTVEAVKGEYAQVTDVLRELGAMPNLRGYGYVREAVLLVLNDPTIITEMTKRLYPNVAERFNTTPSKVERAIRHCVFTIWDRGNQEALKRFFGTPWEKPTNSLFIASLLEELRVYRMVRA